MQKYTFFLKYAIMCAKNISAVTWHIDKFNVILHPIIDMP